MRIEAGGGGRVRQVTANYLDYLVVNNSQAPFDDVRVRRALNLALNRDDLCKVVSGFAAPARGFIPPASPAYQGEAVMKQSGFRVYRRNERGELLADYLKEEKGRESFRGGDGANYREIFREAIFGSMCKPSGGRTCLGLRCR